MLINLTRKFAKFHSLKLTYCHFFDSSRRKYIELARGL